MKIGYGSIQGFTHRKLEYNNQDAVLVLESDECTVGLITDGCGSGTNSEVGAQLALKYLLGRITSQIQSDWRSNLKEDMQEYTLKLAALHGKDSGTFIKDFLLYTIIGFVETNDTLTLFSYGDGVIIIDDDVEVINQNNRPRYLNNELIDGEGGQFEYKELALDNRTIIIGSDGMEDFIEGIEKGLIEEYKSMDQFVGDETNFNNPIHIPNLLKKYSRNGVLRDDCSMVMIKK
jgi:hypothetical protein